MSDLLPITDRIIERPVFFRYMRRQWGIPMFLPSEGEKQDAIRILKEGAWTDNPRDDPIYCEAELIFVEASQRLSLGAYRP
jgi:hypothetical protein